MGKTYNLEIPLNRVEGDLELKVQIEDNRINDAWISGVMFRDFENILKGRAALDGIVITPRICGICSTGHLYAANKAIEMILDIEIPDNAVRLRNLALMVEMIQGDMRHGFLYFFPQFVNITYSHIPMFSEAVRRYAPLKGEIYIETIKETKKLLEIMGIIGGQWPHTSFMIPGGVSAIPNESDLVQCVYLLKHFKFWYEKRILGCHVERFLEVKNASDLDIWLNENELHQKSDLGFYIRYAKEIGLDSIGKGHCNFISFGGFDHNIIHSGFSFEGDIEEFNHEKISESLAYSWFKDNNRDEHPFQGETRAYATGKESKKYSWAKAPRYKGIPAETGPLSEKIISGNPLFYDLIKHKGPNVFIRELSRLVRVAETIPIMEKYLHEISHSEPFYLSPKNIVDGEGFGLINVARGALGHWVKIKQGKISNYQIITPTSWNASPRDSAGIRGPMEEALIGTQIDNISNLVNIEHVIRSFDPCLVCTVHSLKIRN
ncbi:MAG: nickel-dependent hydrogenase large subunit [Desulfobacterales bacterium]|nr:nickel-dependent hydrogenase large subunit [Desulfobacterales bacterium]MBF0397066.1 nickel-dependent hydrogenase large subunit [Desulfobacterales bacterium]